MAWAHFLTAVWVQIMELHNHLGHTPLTNTRTRWQHCQPPSLPKAQFSFSSPSTATCEASPLGRPGTAPTKYFCGVLDNEAVLLHYKRSGATLKSGRVVPAMRPSPTNSCLQTGTVFKTSSTLWLSREEPKHIKKIPNPSAAEKDCLRDTHFVTYLQKPHWTKFIKTHPLTPNPYHQTA